MNLPAVGFKEWSLVCGALGAGAQSIILRKGGIHEGKGGFWWRHDAFLLFPTGFHQQQQQFHWASPSGPPDAPPEDSGETPARHTLEYAARVEAKYQITDWAVVEQLAALHFWDPAVIRERFVYDDAEGISLAFVRVFRLSQPWTFPHERKFGGCRSWLDLPDPPPDLKTEPVLSETSHAERKSLLETIMTEGSAAPGLMQDSFLTAP